MYYLLLPSQKYSIHNTYTFAMAYIPNYKAKEPTRTPHKPSGQLDPDNKKDPFYKTNRWKVKSVAQRNAHPYCAQCKKEGRIVLGRVADHIISMSVGGARLDDNNLQTLCDPCHNKKRQEESRGIHIAHKLNWQGEKIPQTN